MNSRTETVEKQAGYTPGPWQVTASIVDGNFTVYELENTQGAESEAEAEANARLIAAAPELLEALKEIHKLWCCPAPHRLKDWSARCDVMADYARTAIARAEGGAS